MIVLVLLLAFCLDLALGDPAVACHPVRLLGRLAARLEKALYGSGWHGMATGLVLATLHPALVITCYLAIRLPVLLLPGALATVVGVAMDALALYSCIAFRDLFDHVRPILTSLESGELPAARQAVQCIVGRDASLLDQAGVARAAIESVAESLSDGAVGPIFWFTVASTVGLAAGGSSAQAILLGVGCALCFRAVNTLDSMVGYRSERYLHFGRASARFDDVLGLAPSRFTVLCLAASVLCLRLTGAPGLKLLDGLRTWWRDRGHHPSPNAGQSESFVAGALGVRLGGPTVYAHGTTDKPWLGDGTALATPAHLRLACRLIFSAGTVAVVSAVVMAGAVAVLINRNPGV